MDKKEEETEDEERELRKKTSELVSNEIYHNLCLTAEKELKENPELLYEAKNYKEDEDGEYPEIYEYWAVSSWIADKLEARGEIIFEMLDFIVWGRQATGQAISMDNVIKGIAKEMI